MPEPNRRVAFRAASHLPLLRGAIDIPGIPDRNGRRSATIRSTSYRLPGSGPEPWHLLRRDELGVDETAHGARLGRPDKESHRSTKDVLGMSLNHRFCRPLQEEGA